MGSKVWEGRGCCCGRAPDCVFTSLRKESTEHRRDVSRLLRGLCQEEQASAASPALSLVHPLICLLTALLLSQTVNWETHSQGSLGWLGGRCAVVTFLQSRTSQPRAHARRSWKSHPYLKRKFSAWLHHGFSWLLFPVGS